MKFNKEDLNSLLAEGEAEYKVMSCLEKPSKKDGKPQFEIECQVADINGKTALIKTWVPLWKLEEFCLSGGLEAEFEKCEVNESDCLRAEGKCIVKTRKGEMGENGKFPDQNIIAEFIKRDPNAFKDDDVNF